MKILLIGFKLSIGNELYMKILEENFIKNGVNVVVCGEERVMNNWNRGYGICKGNNALQMFKDTISIKNHLKVLKLLIKEKPNVIFFVSSHTLNNVSIVLAKLCNSKIQIISHIHDPKPHSGTSYSCIIVSSQMIQCWLSDKILVYGKSLSEMVHQIYGISTRKIQYITHGTYRKEIDEVRKIEQPFYISLLGRIEEYKGIDIFLRAVAIILNEIDSNSVNFKFLIGGAGDLEKYRILINTIPVTHLEIRNYLIPNEEFDSILSKSYVCVLPYKDGTQTGNIQIAYYNACPVIVTQVGSLPELVDDKETGFVITPNNEHELAESIIQILKNISLQNRMSKKAFEYYLNNLRWSEIIKKLIDVLHECSHKILQIL